MYYFFIENGLIFYNAYFAFVGLNMTYTEIKEVCCVCFIICLLFVK